MKLAADKVLRAGAGSLAVFAMLGVAGCSAINPQATTNVYSASDGVKDDIGDVAFRHIALVGQEEGQPARLIGSVINDSPHDDATVEISAAGETFEVSVPAGESVSLEEEEEFIVPSLDTLPGSMEELTFTVNGESDTVEASVLNGVLAEYRHLLPEDYDPATTDHLEHGPDTYGGGAAHHDPEEETH